MSWEPPQVFISHTRKDREFCNVFDSICARVGIKAFRSEYEQIQLPAWRTILSELGKSCSLFLLVGSELVESQKIGGPEWEFTQNWIAFEIGAACALGLDVWVVCDDLEINFPVPYLTNYLTVSPRNENCRRFLVGILKSYAEGWRYPLDPINSLSCPYDDCRATFNFWVEVPSGYEITCPCCLRKMVFLRRWSPTYSARRRR